MKKQVFPRLYQVMYREQQNGVSYYNVFTQLGDAIDFLKYVSTRTSYFFGQIHPFRTVPSAISCLDTEDELLFQIFKCDDVVTYNLV